MSLSALWAERLGEVGHGTLTTARSQQRQIQNFEAPLLAPQAIIPGSHPPLLASPPANAGGEGHDLNQTEATERGDTTRVPSDSLRLTVTFGNSCYM